MIYFSAEHASEIFGKNRRLLPNNCILARFVLGLALHAEHLDAARVERSRDSNLDLLCQQRRFEAGLQNDLREI